MEMAFSAAVPMSFKYLVDWAIVPHDEKILLIILAVLASGLIVVSAAGLGLDYVYAKFSINVLNDLRLRMFKHLQQLSANFFRARKRPISSRAFQTTSRRSIAPLHRLWTDVRSQCWRFF